MYAWVGFQFFWLLCRSLFFHIAEGTNRIVYPILKGEKWEILSYGLKERVLELLLALCKYGTLVHPRGSYSYYEDVMDLGSIRQLLAHSTFTNEYPLDSLVEKKVTLKIRAVMGDTLLVSTSWFYGSKLTAMDMYDCCVVFLEVSVPSSPSSGDVSTPRLLAIPACRPLCASRARTRPDVESGPHVIDCDHLEVRRSSPKGLPNPGIEEVEWYIWIPCSNGRWIQVHSTQMKLVGRTLGADVMTGDEVTKRLGVGDLNIDLENVQMVQGAVEVARTAVQSVRDLFG